MVIGMKTGKIGAQIDKVVKMKVDLSVAAPDVRNFTDFASF